MSNPFAHLGNAKLIPRIYLQICEGIMLRTICIGSCVSIQGLLVANLADGKIKIAVGNTTYVGRPVETKT